MVFGDFLLKVTVIITLDWKVPGKEALYNQKPGNTQDMLVRNKSNYMEMFLIPLRLSSSIKFFFLKTNWQAHLEPSQTSMIEPFAKSSIVDVWLCCKGASAILYWYFVLTTGRQESQLK